MCRTPSPSNYLAGADTTAPKEPNTSTVIYRKGYEKQKLMFENLRFRDKKGEVKFAIPQQQTKQVVQTTQNTPKRSPKSKNEKKLLFS